MNPAQGWERRRGPRVLVHGTLMEGKEASEVAERWGVEATKGQTGGPEAGVWALV